jgi:multiple sugar transport system substrate-binding protein
MKAAKILVFGLLALMLLVSACTPVTPAPVVNTPVENNQAAPTAATVPTEAAPAVTAAPTKSAEKVDLTFSVWGDPAELVVLQALADDFSKENPTIKVTVTVADWTTYWDKLQTQLAAGTPPDVFAMDAPLYPDYQSRGVILNLQPFIEKDKFSLDDYYPAALQCYKTADGYYGLPRDIQPSVLYYNKDMFDKAGVPYPDDTWTWDTMIEQGKKLTKENQYGLWADLWDMELYWASAIYQNGGQILSADNTKTLIAEPAALGAWQWFHDMLFKYKIMPTPSAAQQFGDPFESGNAAMTTAGHWVVPLYSKVSFKWGVAPLPKGKERVSLVNSVGFVVAKDTKNPEAAWAFLKYLVGVPGQTKITSTGLGVPALKSIANSDLFLKQSSVSIDQKVFLDAMEYAKVKPCFRGYNEWSTVIGDGMTPIWNGEAELKTTLDEIVPKADEVLKNAK